jgi:hypothetical protein
MTLTPLQEALAPASDQLNADDLIPGPRTIKITAARITEANRQKRVTLNFEGDQGRPFKPCKTMARAMTLVWSITNEEQFVGKSITVYRDPEVAFGDQGKIGGIRISHMSHIDGPKTVKLTIAQGRKANFVFQPITAEVRQIAGKPADPNAAEKWANDHLGFVAGAMDLERLAAIQESGRKAMDKLAGANPELHAKITAAYAAKLDALSDADDPFTGDGVNAGGEEG